MEEGSYLFWMPFDILILAVAVHSPNHAQALDAPSTPSSSLCKTHPLYRLYPVICFHEHDIRRCKVPWSGFNEMDPGLDTDRPYCTETRYGVALE
jgi:hypothetical protein